MVFVHALQVLVLVRLCLGQEFWGRSYGKGIRSITHFVGLEPGPVRDGELRCRYKVAHVSLCFRISIAEDAMYDH